MKETTRSAIIAGLAVLAVALAAATLDSTVVPERGPSGDPAGGGGDGNGGAVPVSEPESTPSEAVEVPWLAELLAILAVIGLLACIAYALVHRRRALAVVLGTVVILGLLYLLARDAVWPMAVEGQPPGLPEGTPFAGGDGSGGGGSDTSQPTPPSLVVLLVLGLGLVGAVVALLRSTADESDDAPTGDESGREDAAAVGRAAGRAADRLEEESNVDNEVYRAWREMTELLDVDDPETSTPGEFAAAAVEAGLGRDDVDEITRLFEDVRYGDAEPSADRERRAVAIFRRIEDRYAGDER